MVIRVEEMDERKAEAFGREVAERMNRGMTSHRNLSGEMNDLHLRVNTELDNTDPAFADKVAEQLLILLNGV
jgi:hypothetical protein